VSFLSSLLVWANVPFVVALGVALGFGLLQMTGLLGLLAGHGVREDDRVPVGHRRKGREDAEEERGRQEERPTRASRRATGERVSA
jgi:hypothetical protein